MDRVDDHKGYLTRASHKPEESAIALHAATEKHEINWKGVKLLASTRNKLKLNFLESIYIRRGRYLVNGNDGLKLDEIWYGLIGKEPIDKKTSIN